jgi:hypothetical protein
MDHSLRFPPLSCFGTEITEDRKKKPHHDPNLLIELYCRDEAMPICTFLYQGLGFHIHFSSVSIVSVQDS